MRRPAATMCALFLACLLPAPAAAITRCEVLARAQTWVDAKVPYSQSSYFTNTCGTYRQDCSGYVSMAWDLNSSYVTSTLPSVSSKLGSWSDLKPGDAVNHTCCHVVLFKAWVQKGTSFKVYAEAHTGTVAQIQDWTVSYAQSNGYAPYRRDNIKECCTPHCDGTKRIDENCDVISDCAAKGEACVHDALGLRCVSGSCPAIGDKKVCVSDTVMGTCKDGAITKADCAKSGGVCSTAGVSEARCVSTSCVSSTQQIPVAHDICLTDGRIASCTAAGALTGTKSCPTGQTCTTNGTGVACAEPAPDQPPPVSDGSDAPASDPFIDETDPGNGAPSLSRAATEEPLSGGCSMTPGAPASGSLLLLILAGLLLFASGCRAGRREP
jgi:hypothetical protein